MAGKYTIKKKSYGDALYIANCWPGCFIKHIQFFSTADNTLLADDSASDSVGWQTKYGFRQPTRADGTPFWGMTNLGDQPTEQANMDSMLTSLIDAGVKALTIWWYANPALWAASPPPGGIVISDAHAVIERYLSSSLKSQIKMCVTIDSLMMSSDASNTVPGRLGTGGGWLNEASFANDVASICTDPNYLTINGRPVIILFNSSSNPWTLAHANVIRTAVTTATGQNPYLLNGNWDFTQASSCGLDAVAAYGGLNGSPTSPAVPYTTVIANDRTLRFSTAAYTFKEVTSAIDSRPWHNDGGNYTDLPTRSQWELNLRTAVQQAIFDNFQHALIMYSLGEVGEAGAFLPTPQLKARSEFDTNPLGIYLDVLRDTLFTNTVRTSYWDHYHPQWSHADITRTGSWTLVGNQRGSSSAASAFMYFVMRSSTADDVISLAPALETTRLVVRGTLQPGGGSVAFQLDGGGYGSPVSLSSGSALYNQVLYDSGDLAAGLHRVDLKVVSGQVDIDELRSKTFRPLQ